MSRGTLRLNIQAIIMRRRAFQRRGAPIYCLVIGTLQICLYFICTVPPVLRVLTLSSLPADRSRRCRDRRRTGDASHIQVPLGFLFSVAAGAAR